MSIPLNLLADTEGRAVGFATYGGPGLDKTRSMRTLPPPICVFEFEGGTGGLTPWIRRKRRSDQSTWEVFTQEQREHAFSLFLEDYRTAEKVPPAGLIDLISFDPMRFESYDEFVQELGNFKTGKYSSLGIDAALEFSQMTQTFSKGAGNSYEPMKLPLWGGAQERAGIAVRRIRGLRAQGIFIYITGGEDIDKDFVQDPRELKLAPGEKPPAPFAIKGSIQLPGKLVGVVTHAVDNLFHAKTVNGKSTWVCQREPLGDAGAYWEAKDRWGRLERYVAPNFFGIFASLYGKETARAIYSQARSLSDQAGA